HNLVEERVLTMYDELRPQVTDFCGCEICRGDVLVYALNRLTARYVASTEGKVMTELKLDSGQNRVNMEVMLMEGFRRVSMAPRCGKASRV
ncbi:MAG: late competence development ComFB family protein, partial [Gemmatimonadota bacterium]